MQIIVNGETREVESEPGTPLLWVLRDELGLTGTKFGCGIASCGACTVHVDGRAVRSCVLPIERVGGAVTTIEGLAGGGPAGQGAVTTAEVADEVADRAVAGGDDAATAQPGDTFDANDTADDTADDEALHPLQRAWIEHQVAQCGYCQSGQIMAASALLAVDAAPSDAAIDRALAGNLCRCGTYGRIRAAIRAVADAAPPERSRAAVTDAREG